MKHCPIEHMIEKDKCPYCENNKLKNALLKIATRKMSMYLSKDDMLNDFIKIANDALKK